MATHNNGITYTLHFVFLILTLLFMRILYAQSGYLPREDFTGAAYTLAVYEVNFEGVDSKSSARLSYERIKGSPYYFDEFLNATFFKSNQRKVSGLVKARLNLATHEIHFLGENGEEFVAPPELSAQVEFENSVVFYRNVPGMMVNNKPVLGFSQQLVSGTASLFKYTKRYVASADSLFGTLKRYYFANTHYYFIQSTSYVTHINKMSDDVVLSILHPSNDLNLWVRKNNLNFKREEDLIAYVREWNRLQSLSTK